MIDADTVEFRTAGTFTDMLFGITVTGYTLLNVVAMAKGTGA